MMRRSVRIRLRRVRRKLASAHSSALSLWSDLKNSDDFDEADLAAVVGNLTDDIKSLEEEPLMLLREYCGGER